ncbi:MAG: glycosyltransferase family 4 protein [Planctomycetota bacterium]
MTEFPNQTSVAMWRVAVAMRELGETVQLLSTRRSGEGDRFRQTFGDELASVHHAWPPRLLCTFREFTRRPKALFRSLVYIGKLQHESKLGRWKLLALVASGASLASYCRRKRLDHVLVHSMANAAHLISFARLFHGSPFSLRLGGDLEVYGGDHRVKVEAASLVIAAADNNRKQVIEELGISPNRVIQSSLGVDCERFHPALPIRSIVNSKRAIRLITVARLNRNKGHLDAITAVDRLIRNGVAVTYRIVGDGPFRAELEERVSKLGLKASVFFAGPANEASVIRDLRSSDVFVLPSIGKGEATPVALLEAMACGLPAIATRIGGIPRMLDHGINGFLIDQRSPDSIVDCVQALLDEGNMYRSLSEAARRTAEKHDCRLVARNLLDAIQSTISEPQS